MSDARDPIEEVDAGSIDLYDITTWEPRTRLDRVSLSVYRGIVRATRAAVILAALVILVAQFALTGLAAVANPWVGAFILLSVVPALAIALYVWRVDVTMREPLRELVMTFLLGILFAGFAAVLNTLTRSAFATIPLIGMALYFYLVVAPIEETVKWLAVRLYAYRSGSFDAVIDGAVYGAVAGLGFATIENTIYIGQQYMNAIEAGRSVFAATVRTAAVRSFAGPGHVIYSGFAGYYLGLAKFNRENAGPIVVKGLLIAAFVHATYNTLVGVVPTVAGVLLGVPAAAAFIGFVVVYDGVFGYALYRKISRYRSAYRATDAGNGEASPGDVRGDDPLEEAAGAAERAAGETADDLADAVGIGDDPGDEQDGEGGDGGEPGREG